MSVYDRTTTVLIWIFLGVFLTVSGVAAQAQKCGRLLEADNGDLDIQASSSSCLYIIKLENMTGISLEVKHLTMEPIIAIPEQNTPTPNLQSTWIVGPTNTYAFEGKMLAIVAPSRNQKVSLSWSGITVDTNEVTVNAKFERNSKGTLKWLQSSVGVDKIFWALEPEATGQFNWELNSDLPYCGHDNPCQCISFGVVHVMPNGTIGNVHKSCDGSSLGSWKFEKNSKILLSLHMDSLAGAGSSLQVTWEREQELLKRNVTGILVGTDVGLYVVAPHRWKKIKLTSKHVQGVSFGWNSNKIYFAEKGAGIMRVNPDGTGVQQLMLDDNAFGLGIEPITGNLYYGSRSSNSLRVCDNDVLKCSTIVSGVGNIYDIAFDRSKGFVFWSDMGGKTIRANLDGTNVTEIVKERSYGINVDERESRLYVGTGMGNQGLTSCDLDGKDVKKVPNFSNSTNDVEINGDAIYTNDYYAKTLHVAQGISSTFLADFANYSTHIALFGEPLSRHDEKLEDNGLLADPTMSTRQCGGFISLQTTEEILYQIPAGVQSVNCIWVIWAEKGGPIRVKNEPNRNAEFHSSFQLVAAESTKSTNFNRFNLPLGREELLELNSYKFTVIFFKAIVTKPGQGVYLKLKDTGVTSSTHIRPNFKELSLRQRTGTYEYPPGWTYENNERVFAIGQVPQGKFLRIVMDHVSTEECCDWFRIMWLDSTLNAYTYYGNGTSASGTLLIPASYSYIITFKSDSSVTRSGMKFSYSVSDS